MLTLDRLSQLIDEAEFLKTGKRGTKRLFSIVTDHFFETTIRPRQELGLDSCHATGWMTCTDSRSNVRRWFKMVSPEHSKEVSRLCLDFIRALLIRSPQDEFYLVSWTLSSSGSVGYTLRQIICNDSQTRFETSNCAALEQSVNQSISTLYRAGSSNSPDAGAGAIHSWLTGGSFTHEQLQQILATRIFLNFSGLYLTDIDLLTRDGDRLCIVEFKRKYPTQGARFLFHSTPTSFASVLAAFEKGFDTRSLRHCSYPQPEAFGLDHSHLKVLSHVSRSEIVYRHVIWDTRTRELPELLTCDLKPKSSLIIRYRDLDCSSFCGITSAPPGESGTYSEHNARTQALMNAADFRTFSMPAVSGSLDNNPSGNRADHEP